MNYFLYTTDKKGYLGLVEKKTRLDLDDGKCTEFPSFSTMCFSGKERPEPGDRIKFNNFPLTFRVKDSFYSHLAVNSTGTPYCKGSVYLDCEDDPEIIFTENTLGNTCPNIIECDINTGNEFVMVAMIRFFHLDEKSEHGGGYDIAEVLIFKVECPQTFYNYQKITECVYQKILSISRLDSGVPLKIYSIANYTGYGAPWLFEGCKRLYTKKRYRNLITFHFLHSTGG